MEIKGLHFLLTYQCTFECDHCFVWGSPRQSGVMTLEQVARILHQARAINGLSEIYFEGGEPFLYYPILSQAVRLAVELGFQVGIVSNAYWATTPADARLWLEPLAGWIVDLTVSSDLYHSNEIYSRQAQYATEAAHSLGIPTGMIQVAQPEMSATPSVGQILPTAMAEVMYRGRAASRLAGRAPLKPWETLNRCPFEDLSDSGRLHVDPFGYLHLCQGIALGNLYKKPLDEILLSYSPEDHPIAGPLLAGGPAELVRRYHLPHEAAYADACHLCYTGRLALRPVFPDILAPDEMYSTN